LQHVWLMPGSPFVPQQVLPHTLSFRQHSPPPPPGGRMNLPPSDLYPAGQQTATLDSNATRRSRGQHVYRLWPLPAGTRPDPFAIWAQVSPRGQQIGLLPGEVSHAFVPLGQHFATPLMPAHVSLLLQQSPVLGSQHVLPRWQHLRPHGR
jgi:hypothetical protein